MKTLNLIVSRFIIFFLGASLAFDYGYEFFIGSSLEFCDCTDFKHIYLANEIIQFLFITFMALVTYRLKLCLSNKLAVIGLYINNIVNLLILTIGIPYELYVDLLNQISVTAIFIISILYLLKKKT